MRESANTVLTSRMAQTDGSDTRCPDSPPFLGAPLSQHACLVPVCPYYHLPHLTPRWGRAQAGCGQRCPQPHGDLAGWPPCGVCDLIWDWAEAATGRLPQAGNREAGHSLKQRGPRHTPPPSPRRLPLSPISGLCLYLFSTHSGPLLRAHGFSSS